MSKWIKIQKSVLVHIFIITIHTFQCPTFIAMVPLFLSEIFPFMALSANFCHLSCNTFHTAILMVIWCHYVPILLSLYLTWIVVALKRLFLAIFNVLMQKYFRIHLSGKRCEKCHSIITHSHTHTLNEYIESHITIRCRYSLGIIFRWFGSVW